MLKEHYFRVAGFPFRISLPERQDPGLLLPSFTPFRYECGDAIADRDLLFHFTARTEPLPDEKNGRMLDESETDMGHVRLWELTDGYRIELNRTPGGYVHVMHIAPDFRYVQANICWDAPHAGEALNSLLRILFSQAVLPREGISIHAAAVVRKEQGYLFMGKSGTGKSTHARLWLRCFPDCELLNDDNPVLRIENGQVIVYGTPWSGKTPCYQNRRFPVGGIVRLAQAPRNQFIPRKDVDAFITLLSGCSGIRTRTDLYDHLCDTLSKIAVSIPIGKLECRPDKEAAVLCATALKQVAQPNIDPTTNR